MFKYLDPDHQRPHHHKWHLWNIMFTSWHSLILHRAGNRFTLLPTSPAQVPSPIRTVRACLTSLLPSSLSPLQPLHLTRDIFLIQEHHETPQHRILQWVSHPQDSASDLAAWSSHLPISYPITCLSTSHPPNPFPEPMKCQALPVIFSNLLASFCLE